jgi:uncharacterized membrane protein
LAAEVDRTSEEADIVTDGAARAPRAAFVLAVAGLLVSAYLTYEHYTAASTFACPESATVNCVKVTTSSYSAVHGAPVALLGLLFYVTVTVLCLPLAPLRTRTVAYIRLAMASLGVAFVIYLLWAELFRIDAICLWCTAVHVITVGLFGVLVYDAAS